MRRKLEQTYDLTESQLEKILLRAALKINESENEEYDGKVSRIYELVGDYNLAKVSKKEDSVLALSFVSEINAAYAMRDLKNAGVDVVSDIYEDKMPDPRVNAPKKLVDQKFEKYYIDPTDNNVETREYSESEVTGDEDGFYYKAVSHRDPAKIIRVDVKRRAIPGTGRIEAASICVYNIDIDYNTVTIEEEDVDKNQLEVYSPDENDGDTRTIYVELVYSRDSDNPLSIEAFVRESVDYLFKRYIDKSKYEWTGIKVSYCKPRRGNPIVRITYDPNNEMQYDQLLAWVLYRIGAVPFTAKGMDYVQRYHNRKFKNKVNKDVAIAMEDIDDGFVSIDAGSIEERRIKSGMYAFTPISKKEMESVDADIDVEDDDYVSEFE